MQQMRGGGGGGGGMSELYGAAANEHYVSHEDLNQYFAHQRESQEQNARRQERARKQANLRGGSQYGQQPQMANPNPMALHQQAPYPPQAAPYPPQAAPYPPQGPPQGPPGPPHLQNPYPGDMFNPYDPPPAGYPQQPMDDPEARYRQYYKAYDNVIGDGQKEEGSQYPRAMSGQYGEYGDPEAMKRRRRELEYEEQVAEEETDVAVTNYKSLLRVAAHFGESLADTLDFRAIETQGISKELDKSIKRGEFDQFAQRMQSSRAVEFMREPLSGTATSLSLLVLKNHLKNRGKRAATGRKSRRRRRQRKSRYEQSDTESEDEDDRRSSRRRSRSKSKSGSKSKSRSRMEEEEIETESESDDSDNSDVCNSHIKAREKKKKRREKALERLRRRAEAAADAQSGVSRVDIPFEQHAAASKHPAASGSVSGSVRGSARESAAMESYTSSHLLSDAPSAQQAQRTPKRTATQAPSAPSIAPSAPSVAPSVAPSAAGPQDLPEEKDPPLPKNGVEVKCNDAVIKSLTDSTKMMTGMANVLQQGSEIVNTRIEQQNRAEELEAIAPDDFGEDI